MLLEIPVQSQNCVTCRFGAEALFKEDDQTVEDKSKALYEDSIDAILARAEVRGTRFARSTHPESPVPVSRTALAVRPRSCRPSSGPVLKPSCEAIA